MLFGTTGLLNKDICQLVDTNPVADINKGGKVDVKDLSILLVNWLK